jgi:hypothetical protein
MSGSYPVANSQKPPQEVSHAWTRQTEPGQKAEGRNAYLLCGAVVAADFACAATEAHTVYVQQHAPALLGAPPLRGHHRCNRLMARTPQAEGAEPCLASWLCALGNETRTERWNSPGAPSPSILAQVTREYLPSRAAQAACEDVCNTYANIHNIYARLDKSSKTAGATAKPLAASTGSQHAGH